jgi:hypothetical protein
MLTTTVADHLAFNYRPDLRVLIARWRRSVSLPELQDGYHRLADEAERHAATCWLLDVRQLMVSIEAGSWVGDVFYPLLAARFGCPLYLAYLLPPESRRLLRTNAEMAALLSKFEQNQHQQCYFRLFDQEGDAYHWLAVAPR